MLLLTDRIRESHHLQQAINGIEACSVVALHHALTQTPGHSMIACDVALGDEPSINMVRAALTHHRMDHDVPVLFLTRDHSHLAHAQATALGASDIVHCSAAPELLRSTITRLIASRRRARAAGPPPAHAVEARAHEAKAALSDILGRSARNEAISVAALAQSGNLVIAAIRQDKIRAWLDVVWKYHNVTYQHCLLVAGLVTAFSLKLGLASQSQQLLSQAALIHDVGKARIAHSILNKAGRLSDAETEVIRTHPAVGYEMLVRQPGIDPNILDIVRHHHEYLDGSGYPDRLRDNQISGFVRLVTVCDIFAALIERRPYKEPMTPHQAFSVLAGMGNKLDSGLVAAFESVARES